MPQLSYQWLLLDADNTLFDFGFAERHALENAFSDCGLPCGDAVYRYYQRCNDALWKELETGKVTRGVLKTLRFSRTVDWMKENGLLSQAQSPDPMQLNRLYVHYLGKEDKLMDGAFPLCRDLSARYSLAMITNGTASVQHSRIDSSGLTPYFRHVFISEELGAQKPAAAFFDKVCDTIALTDRTKALIIGDSLSSDMLGAYHAGIDACFLNTQTPPPFPPIRYHVRNYAELSALLL